MTGQLFISLLNPAIGLSFATVFFLLWLHRRERYIAYAAGAYVATAIAFLIQDVAPTLPMQLQRLPANIGFLLTGALFAAAIIRRYGLAVPWRAIAATMLVSTIVFTWFLIARPSIPGRIYAISIGAGIIALMIVRALWPLDKPHLIDKVLFLVALFSAANLIVRPILILTLSDGYATYDGFQQSIYWTTVQFSQAMVSVVAAISLMVAVAIDIIAELRAEARADPLSGLLNRRGFEAAATAALRRSDGANRSASLMIADLDHFKGVNDRQGHAVGDAIIAAFGELVRRESPAGAVAGRIGGEEFALLLPGTKIDAARRIAEVVRTGLAPACDGRIPPALAPTVSIGLAISTPGTGLSQLMRQADQALYEAKRGGRDNVRAYTAAAPLWAAG